MTKISGDSPPLPLSAPAAAGETTPPPAAAPAGGAAPSGGGQVEAFKDTVVHAGAGENLKQDLLDDASGVGATEMGWNPIKSCKDWIAGKVTDAFGGLVGGIRKGGEAIGGAVKAVDDAVKTMDKGLQKVGLKLGEDKPGLNGLADKMRQVQAETEKRYPGMSKETKKLLNEEFQKNLQKAIKKNPALVPKEMQDKPPTEIDFKKWKGDPDELFKGGEDVLKVKDGDGSSSLRA